MRVLNSQFALLHFHSSRLRPDNFPISTFSNPHGSLFGGSAISTFCPAFLQTTRWHGKLSLCAKPTPRGFLPKIWKPPELPDIQNGSDSVPSSSATTSRYRDEVVADLPLFLELVPPRMRKELLMHEEMGALIEVVMDLGRQPLARFPSGDWLISEQPVSIEDLLHAISKVGEFGDHNRSGINRSLHRISAIRNRKMQIIGLTCRVGRAVSGSAEIIHDLVERRGSLLVIGPPGVGKTTLIRDIARMLADDQNARVINVDTSNEIGGDGDVPHSEIGRSRRMQVPNVKLQHNVMIEAVENHMPETIIIDEIGTELEAQAASIISQRGVQLVATAHGMTIDSVVQNMVRRLGRVGYRDDTTMSRDRIRDLGQVVTVSS